MKTLRSTLFTGLIALALVACGGEGGMGLDEDEDTGGGDGNTREIVADPSYANVIQEIFNRKGCAASSCHGASQQAGLDLRTGNSYGNLVNVTSTQSTAARVTPGNADDSYLIIKVEGRQSVGARMPLNGSPLDNIDLTNLKNWINTGAKNN